MTYVDPLYVPMPDGPPPAVRPAPAPASGDFHTGDFRSASLHEAAHVVVARALGLHVVSVLADGDGAGVTSTLYECGDAGSVMALAMATAAGVVLNRRLRVHESRHQDDLLFVASLQARYRDLHGRPMPCPFAGGGQILRESGDAVFRLAAAMRPGRVYGAAEIDAMLA